MKLFDLNIACGLALCSLLACWPLPLFADEESDGVDTRGYNSAASATVRNLAAMEDRFYTRFETVGTTETGDELPGSGGNTGLGEELVGPLDAALGEEQKKEATQRKKQVGEDGEVRPDALISGTDPKGSIKGWGITVDEGICLRIDSSAERDSYIVYARHIESGRAYAKDADGASALFCENEDWIGEVSILAEPAVATKGRDDLLGQPCGGRQTAVWTPLSEAVILDTKRAVKKLRESSTDADEDPKTRAWAKQATAWFVMAKKGDADARYHLGQLFQHGQGLSRDAEMAAEWFRMAAEQGHPSALADLGFCYAQGRGVAKNVATSRELLRQSVTGLLKTAETGDVFAQTNLGRMYAVGAGCRELKGNMAWRNKKGADPGCLEKDEERAVEWLRRAAEQGHPDAQGRLGAKYLTGFEIQREGQTPEVRRDEGQAAEWLRRAAEQGDGAAQFMLGMMYMHGRGLPKDPRQGAEWLRRAEERGVNGAGQAMTLLTN